MQGGGPNFRARSLARRTLTNQYHFVRNGVAITDDLLTTPPYSSLFSLSCSRSMFCALSPAPKRAVIIFVHHSPPPPGCFVVLPISTPRAVVYFVSCSDGGGGFGDVSLLCSAMVLWDRWPRPKRVARPPPLANGRRFSKTSRCVCTCVQMVYFYAICHQSHKRRTRAHPCLPACLLARSPVRPCLFRLCWFCVVWWLVRLLPLTRVLRWGGLINVNVRLLFFVPHAHMVT